MVEMHFDYMLNVCKARSQLSMSYKQDLLHDAFKIF
jgi:hypothetical protein